MVECEQMGDRLLEGRTEGKVMMKEMHKLRTTRTILAILLAMAALAISAGLSTAICLVPFYFGILPEIILLLKSILYVGFTLIGVLVIYIGLLRTSLASLRITRFSIRPIWILTAILMPALVVLIASLSGGHWEQNGPSWDIALIRFDVILLLLQLAIGLVEETVFRGVILGCLESRYNKPIAALVSSLLFAAMHLIGHHLDIASTIQVLITGTIVGILFSLITFESNSIWNSAIVHGIWNFVIAGGILHIGTTANLSASFNFILSAKSTLISGGDFGMGASILSISVYAIFCVLTVLLMRRGKNSPSSVK